MWEGDAATFAEAAVKAVNANVRRCVQLCSSVWSGQGATCAACGM